MSSYHQHGPNHLPILAPVGISLAALLGLAQLGDADRRMNIVLILAAALAVMTVLYVAARGNVFRLRRDVADLMAKRRPRRVRRIPVAGHPMRDVCQLTAGEERAFDRLAASIDASADDVGWGYRKGGGAR